MKKTATNLIMMLSLCAFSFGALSIISSCSKDDDDDGGSGGSSASDMCDIEACVNNSTLKDLCIDRVSTCLNIDQGSNDECTAIAIDTCTI
jgi:hypothetical protein